MLPTTKQVNHDLTYQRISGVVEGGGPSTLYRVTESYKGKALYTWVSDDEGNKYRKCDNGPCNHHTLRPVSNGPTWKCSKCVAEREKAEAKAIAKQAYMDTLDERIKQATEMLRKTFPQYRVRKGRKQKTIVYDEKGGAKDEINKAIAAFNLKLGWARDVSTNGDSYSYYRRQADVQDISPLRHLEAVFNGEV